MSRSIYSLIFLLLLSFTSYGQSKSQRKIITALKADIGYLASDALEGRRTGTEGEHKAADYLVARYQKLHIPAYEDSYRHPFKFVRGRDFGKTQIFLANVNQELGPEVFPFSFSDKGDVSGDVLVDVQEHGAIWTMPLYSSADEANDPHFDIEKSCFDRAREANKNGAIGVVFYDGFGSKYPPVFNPRSDFETISIPVAYIGFKTWKKLTADDANVINIRLNIQLVKPEHTANNVAAYIDNHAPLTVVLGAHYDHLGRGEDGGSLYTGKEPLIHNGADDNASGTSALLVLAEWLKKSHLKHYNYLLVHFSGEEMGLLGSKAFVKTPGIDSNHIAFMVNMDMLGRLSDTSKSLTIGGIGTSPIWFSVVRKMEEDGFHVKIDSAGIGPSDHTSFYENSIPVLFFFTGLHADYHKPSDDADKINYPGEAQVISGIEDVLQDLDRSPRPTFSRTKSTSLGRVRFKVTLGIMPDYSWNGEGIHVDGIIEGKPAEKAGIKTGDVIIGLGPDEVKGMQSYMEALSHQKEGGKSRVILLRNGKKLELPIQFQ